LKIRCKTEYDLVPAAEKLLSAFSSSRIFAFYGKMGAGKTTFIKVICGFLGVADIVQSPTFSIINEYKAVSGDSVFHFDFFRITRINEVLDIGYEEYFYSGAYCFIEWPELIEPLLPGNTVKVTITGDTDRMIEF